MKYLGDFIPGQTVVVPWDTFGTDASSVTCTGGTIYIMTGTSGTETSATSLSGSSADTRNFATRTGSHIIFIGTSTLSGGADYMVKLAGATVGASSISPWLGYFSLRNRSNPTIFGRVTVAATGGTDEFQLPTTGGMFSTTANVYRDAAVVVVEGGGRGQSGVASAYATTNGARMITVDFAGGVAVTASSSVVEVFGQGLFGITATQALTATSTPIDANVTKIAGSDVNTNNAQLGVNLVNIAGSVVDTAGAQIGVNVVSISGTNVTTTVAQVGAKVISTSTGAITASSFGAAAITNTVMATGVLTASNFGAGAITNTVIATGALTASSFGAAAITNTVMATGVLTASNFGAGAIDSAALASSAAGKINQFTAALRGGAAFNNFRFSMLATNGSSYATDQSPAISIGFGTAAAVTVTNAVTAIGNYYIVSFTATELPAGQMGIMRATATGALTREISIITTPSAT